MQRYNFRLKYRDYVVKQVWNSNEGYRARYSLFITAPDVGRLFFGDSYEPNTLQSLIHFIHRLAERNVTNNYSDVITITLPDGRHFDANINHIVVESFEDFDAKLEKYPF